MVIILLLLSLVAAAAFGVRHEELVAGTRSHSLRDGTQQQRRRQLQATPSLALRLTSVPPVGTLQPIEGRISAVFQPQNYHVSVGWCDGGLPWTNCGGRLPRMRSAPRPLTDGHSPPPASTSMLETSLGHHSPFRLTE